MRAWTGTRRAVLPLFLSAGGVLTAALVWSGCSVEEHYEVLSFFFDGVPDPNLTTDVARGGSLLSPLAAGRAGSAHSAYVERRCSDCHGESAEFGVFVTGFSGLDETICITCHADVADAYPRLHGPVAAGACLWCHEAHESAHPKLLTSTAPQLCLRCHEFQLDIIVEVPEHEDLERNCLDCHHGHGSVWPALLREAPTRAEPTVEVEGPPEPEPTVEVDGPPEPEPPGPET